MREDHLPCRRVRQVLESVNGMLWRKYGRKGMYLAGVETDADREAAAVENMTGGSEQEEEEGNGEMSPYVLTFYDMAESSFLADRYGIYTIPMHLLFYRGRLVYAGVMGGSSIVKLPQCSRPVNFLLGDTDYAGLLAAEKVCSVVAS